MSSMSDFSPREQYWMRQALALAEKAAEEGEVPVGAVVVQQDRMVAEAWNRMIGLNDPSAHAEILALRAAGQKLNNYRLPDCDLYVTLEPCCMCAGAIIHARLARVVFAATDPKTGAAGSRFQVLLDPAHNHKPDVAGGCLAAESSELLQEFFRRRRQEKSSICKHVAE